MSCRAVLIGDVVASRRSRDRAALHRHLLHVLEEVNDRLLPETPLRVTAGDEFQGGFSAVGQALHATTWLRLLWAGDGPGEQVVEDFTDLRHGVGWGSTRVITEEPRVEDGPAWWVARTAIETVADQGRRAGGSARRTAYLPAEGLGEAESGPDPDLVAALLLCRDQVLGSCSPRSRRLLRGLMEGSTQAQLAQSEGISASAVSQRVRADGLGVLLEVEERIRRVR